MDPRIRFRISTEMSWIRLPGTLLKGIVQIYEFGGVTRLTRSGIVNWRPGKFFIYNFNDTISREEHKPIYSCIRITGMALSNQSDLMQFWSPASHLIQLCRMGLELVICRLRQVSLLNFNREFYVLSHRPETNDSGLSLAGIDRNF
jgi:hypothetical protein